MVERRSPLILGNIVSRRTFNQEDDVVKYVVGAISKLVPVRTITSNNGKEWSCHGNVVRASGVEVIFSTSAKALGANDRGECHRTLKVVVPTRI